MNLAPALAEAYTYAYTFNREYDGGSNIPEKIETAGLTVDNLLTDINIHNRIEGGSLSKDGPLSNKAIPAGLVLDRRRNKHQIEYESHLDSASSGTISDDLFDKLFDAVSPSKKHRNVTGKRNTGLRKSSTKKQHKK